MNDVEAVFAEVKKLEGKTVTYLGKDPVGAVAIKKYAIAVDDRNPLYLDEGYASKSRYGGIVAPYTFIFENNHDFYRPLEEDGIISGHVEQLPPPFDLLIRGGNEYEFFQRIRPTDIIGFTRTVKSISKRKGKKSPLIVWVNEYVYRNQKGDILAVNRETFLYTSKASG
ncbi:MAG: MaoC family dehydratase N-terminal domain-containing protein [Deltaproteobacteria bacterium]|nr:MaoC family dehydratase N-terminal domain-containing protein [Deltaproteobacteria bacterium]